MLKWPFVRFKAPESLCENGRWPTQTDRSPALRDCFNVLSLGASIFSDAWAFPGRYLSSNTESDFPTGVVRTVKRPEGRGPTQPDFL